MGAQIGEAKKSLILKDLGVVAQINE